VQLSLTVRKVTATLPDLAPISWLGNAVETAALWFFGRGTFDLTLARHRSSADTMTLTITPGSSPGPLNFSGAAPLSSLVQAERFPARLVKPWEPSKDDQREVTMIQNYSVKQDCMLAMLAYGLADSVCELFKRGAMNVQAQYSLAQCQIKGDVGLNDDQLVQFADPAAHSYHPGDHIGMLPWPKDDLRE
jgi:hypothetical protein